MGFVEYVVSGETSTYKLWSLLPGVDDPNCISRCAAFVTYAERLGYSDLLTSVMVSYDWPCVIVVFVACDTEPADISDLAYALRRWCGSRLVAQGYSVIPFSERIKEYR